jgi:hypothetical protein
MKNRNGGLDGTGTRISLSRRRPKGEGRRLPDVRRRRDEAASDHERRTGMKTPVKTAQGWRFKQRRNFPDPPAPRRQQRPPQTPNP